MKRHFILFLLFLSIPLFGQNMEVMGSVKTDLTYSEYDEDSPFYMQTDDDYILNHDMLLNGTIMLAPMERGFAYLDFDLKMAGIVSRDNDELLESIEADLNEAYISAQLLDELFFNLGKKRIVWGVAFFKNPSDFVNPPKNAFDPQAEKRGMPSAELELFSEYFSLNQVVVVYDNLAYFGYGTKLSAYIIPRTDVNLIYYYSENQEINLGFSLDTTPFSGIDYMDDLAFHGEAGFSQTSDVLLAGTNDDTGFPELKQRPTRPDFYKNLIAGLRYTLPLINTMLVTEYYYKDDGYQEQDIEDLVASGLIYDPLLFLEAGNIFRHNIFISLNKLQLTDHLWAFTDTLALQGLMLINPLDRSFFIKGRMESFLVQNTIIGLEMGYYHGEENTEYKLVPFDYYVGFTAQIGF